MARLARGIASLLSPQGHGRDLSKRLRANGVGPTCTNHHHAVFWLWKRSVRTSRAGSRDFSEGSSHAPDVSRDVCICSCGNAHQVQQNGPLDRQCSARPTWRGHRSVAGGSCSGLRALSYFKRARIIDTASSTGTCSHIRSTAHPFCSRRASVSRSLASLLAILFIHHSRFAFGVVA